MIYIKKNPPRSLGGFYLKYIKLFYIFKLLFLTFLNPLFYNYLIIK